MDSNNSIAVDDDDSLARRKARLYLYRYYSFYVTRARVNEAAPPGASLVKADAKCQVPKASDHDEVVVQFSSFTPPYLSTLTTSTALA
jgi:hypothetical protein